MIDNKYRFAEDIALLREILNMSQEDLAKNLDVSFVTLNKWENGERGISAENLEKFYSYAYSKQIEINMIKEQFFREESTAGTEILFHGAKSALLGDIRIDESRENNDFGQGFYMGESFRQAALFVSNFHDSSVYALSFDPTGLRKADYKVDREWLLTIAAYRGRLGNKTHSKMVERIRSKVDSADYIVAPIADNRMFQIIDSFIDGEISDEQCIHALAATNLGKQYVVRSDKAISQIKLLERCYLCNEERRRYVTSRNEDLASADNKVKAARIKYRGKGKYIDELL